MGRDSGKYTFSVACYMLELYQDDLADLLLPVQQLKARPLPLALSIQHHMQPQLASQGVCP